MPPIIPIALGTAGILQGIIQGGQARRAEKAATDRMNDIPRYDPGITQLLGEIRQQRRYAETGSSKMMGLKRTILSDAGAQTMANLARGSGGSAGTLIDSNLRSQNLTQRALAGAAADTEQLSPAYLQMEAPLVMDQADRAEHLDLYARDREMARAARLRRDSTDNIWGGIGLLASADWSAGNTGLFGGGRGPEGPTSSSPYGGYGSSQGIMDSPVPAFQHPGSMMDEEPLFT